MVNKIVTFTTYKSDGATPSGTPFVFGFTDKLGNNGFDNTGDSVDADLEIPPPPPPGSASTGTPISTSYIDSMYVKVSDGENDINAYQYFVDSSDNSDIALDLAVRDYNTDNDNNVVFKYDVNDVSGVFTTLAITNDVWTIDLVGASVTGSGGSNPTVTENGDVRTVTLPHLADNNSFYTMNLKQYVADSGPTEVTQTITFGPGWSWFSIYIDVNDTAINEALTISSSTGQSLQGILIKNTSSSATYINSLNKFLGTMRIYNDSMYKLKNPHTYDIIVTFTGPLITNFTTPIIGSNTGIWNWIPYKNSTQNAIKDVIDDATKLDFIKSSTSSSTRLTDTSWIPAIQLVPGVGYKYKARATKSITMGI